MEYLYLLRLALIYLIVIFWVYELVISLFSLIKFKEKTLKTNKKHKFMAIIPAHNEELVVGNLIESLKAQDYDKDLYDIYVIADNCTDRTALIAENMGAIVYKRFDEEHKTKGYALNWFLKQILEKEDADYDAFCVFDADNIVDKNFLNVMNRKLCQGETVVQGYKDIKNPTGSWISAGYAFFYWTMHRFYHLARFNVGLSPLLNGTGFMVRFDQVKKSGWDTLTLTEDIEFSLKQIIKGEKLGWATDAIVYDEQPEKFGASWKQRTRWTVGHMQCTRIYTKDLIKSIKQKGKLMNLDGFLYIAGSIPMFVLTILLLLSNFAIYAADAMTTSELVFNILRYVLPTFFFPMFTALLTMIVDKKPIKPMLKWLWFYPLFMGSWIIINLKCLFKQDTSWDKIEHVHGVDIKDMAREVIKE